MKTTIIVFILIPIFFLGCKNSGNDDTLNMDEINQLCVDTIPDPNFTLNSEMKSQIELYEYLFSEYVFCIYFHKDTYFYLENFYNLKLFKGINNSFTLKTTYQDNDKQLEIADNYFVDNSGYLIKVQNQEELYWRKEFEYRDGLLVNITNYTKSVSGIQTNQNRVNKVGGNEYKETMEFTYNYNSLIYRLFTQYIGKNRFLNQRISYYTDSKRPSIKYIIKRHESTKTREIICFNNDDIQYVIYTSEFDGKFQEIYKFSSGNDNPKTIGNNMRIDYFDRGKQENKFFKLFKTYDIGYDSQNSINNIIEKIHNETELTLLGIKERETVYKYLSDHNQFVGYEIYQYELPSGSGENVRTEKKYKFIKGVQLLPK